MITEVAIVLAALAVPGLLLRRFGPRLARGAAAAAIGVLVAVVLAPPIDREDVVLGRTIAITTGASSVPPQPAGVELRQGGEHWRETALAAQLGRGIEQPTAVSLVWTDPVGDTRPVPLPGAVNDAYTATPPPPVEPADVHLRAVSALVAGRPAMLELAIGKPPADVSVTVTVHAADGRQVHRSEVAPEALARGVADVEFVPESEGPYPVEVVVQAAGSRVDGRGSLTVAAAPRVVLAGAGAAELAPALAVQGWDAVALDALTQVPTDAAVIVLLQPPPASVQEALAQWVGDGGGLLVVGAEDGGGLVGLEPRLSDLLPVHVTPPPATAHDGEGSGSESAPSKPESTESSPPESQEAREPPPAIEPPAEPGKDLATGDTSGAELAPGPEVEVERRSVAMVLVIDCSGSMSATSLRAGVSKMQYAKTSAYETARALREGDQLGVVTFGLAGDVILELTEATRQDRIRSMLEGLTATAQATLVADALQKATALLRSSSAAVRHIVVVSDGDIQDLVPVNGGYEAARQAAQDGITVSLIQIQGADEVSALKGQKFAQLGGGVFRITQDPSDLPRIVTTEVTRVLGSVGRQPQGNELPREPPPVADAGQPDPTPSAEPASPPDDVADRDEPKPEESPSPREPTEPPAEPSAPEMLPVVAVADSPLLAPVRPDGFPPVGGILEATARPEARTLLVARRGAAGVPLLAFAHRGLGHVGVWTSDFTGGWGAPWRADTDFPARLAQWVAALAPPVRDLAATDLLDARTLSPPAPTRSERTALAAASGGPVHPLAQLAPPPARRHVRQVSQAVDLALAALGAMLVLAVLEWLAPRLRRSRSAGTALAFRRP